MERGADRAVSLMEDDMTTPRGRALVSLVATLTTIGLGACIRTPSRQVADVPAPVERAPLTIRFDNSGREHVHVYLIGDQREWLLGRVEPGAIATLRIPDASLGGRSRFLRLAVIRGAGVTVGAARDPRATFTIAQPASGLMSQQWRYTDGQVTPLRRR
jgi:hypothetical protein